MLKDLIKGVLYEKKLEFLKKRKKREKELRKPYIIFSSSIG